MSPDSDGGGELKGGHSIDCSLALGSQGYTPVTTHILRDGGNVGRCGSVAGQENSAATVEREGASVC